MGKTFYDIKDYEGLYQINSDGLVKSLAKRGGKLHDCILKPISQNGYHRVCLSKNGKKSYFFIHRLIALYFIPNPENKPFINHKNGVRNDNRIENLEWCTHSENIIHSFRVLGQNHNLRGKLGKDAPGFGISRLPNLPTRRIKCDTLDMEFPSITQAVRLLGLSSGNISAICKGDRTHTHGLSFRYL